MAAVAIMKQASRWLVILLGAAVFLDLKFHDIPNTVAKSVAAATRLDVQMLTVHTSGGLEMMQAAEKAGQDAARETGHEPPLVLGVTVLTSLNSSALSEVGQPQHIGAQVERLALLAVNAGLRGLVCSPLELTGLRQLLPEHVQLELQRVSAADLGSQGPLLMRRLALHRAVRSSPRFSVSGIKARFEWVAGRRGGGSERPWLWSFAPSPSRVRRGRTSRATKPSARRISTTLQLALSPTLTCSTRLDFARFSNDQLGAGPSRR